MKDTAQSARILIAGLSGRSGKTVVTLGLLRLLAQSGLVVQPFKKGPDFIDPGWHKLACGRVGRNLDSFFMTPEQIRGVCSRAAQSSDISIIEGAMGLFDGMDALGSTSSAHIAKTTQSPVILVVAATRMTRTAAALVLGCQHFDPELTIAGVILNKVSGQRHEKLLRESIETTCDIPVIGAVPVDSRLNIPDRHLGLLSAAEVTNNDELLDGIAEVIAQCVDVDAVLRIAGTCQAKKAGVSMSLEPGRLGQRARIAVIRDKAFCFYYEENLLALQEHGAELALVDSLRDAALPSRTQALYIGGGFPEIFASKLQENASLKADIKERIESGLPTYAEAGGLAYLGRTLAHQDASYEMVGALPLDTTVQAQRQAHGYAVMEASEACPWLEAGSVLIGHTHHHYQIVKSGEGHRLAFNVTRGRGTDGVLDGASYKEVIATSMHVNSLASPLWAKSFVEHASAYR